MAHAANITYREFGCLVEIVIDEHTSHGQCECAVYSRHTRPPAGLLLAHSCHRLVEKTRNNAGLNVVTSSDMAVVKHNWRDMVT